MSCLSNFNMQFKFYLIHRKHNLTIMNNNKCCFFFKVDYLIFLILSFTLRKYVPLNLGQIRQPYPTEPEVFNLLVNWKLKLSDKMSWKASFVKFWESLVSNISVSAQKPMWDVSEQHYVKITIMVKVCMYSGMGLNRESWQESININL